MWFSVYVDEVFNRVPLDYFYTAFEQIHLKDFTKNFTEIFSSRSCRFPLKKQRTHVLPFVNGVPKSHLRRTEFGKKFYSRSKQNCFLLRCFFYKLPETNKKGLWRYQLFHAFGSI